MSRKKMFLVTIRFIGPLDQWIDEKTGEYRYKVGYLLVIPVMQVSKYHAAQVVENKYIGSMYPDFEVVGVKKCDDFLFPPII